MSQIAPKAWRAMCDLLGGAERVATEPSWGDGFALNLGKPGMEWEPPAADFDGAGWHKVIPRPLSLLSRREMLVFSIVLLTDAGLCTGRLDVPALS